MKLRLLLATTNRGKLRELHALLCDLPGLTLLTPEDVGGLPAVVEDGATFEANARKKARELAAAKGVATLADDSGLEVDALGGRPGVYSARYAGAHATDQANNEKLLAELAGLKALSDAQRAARFRVVIAFCDPSANPAAPFEHTESGVCEGSIRLTPSGSDGFGYDPYFGLRGDTRTMAELPLDEKNRRSHRAQAMQKLRAFLAGYLRDRADA